MRELMRPVRTVLVVMRGIKLQVVNPCTTQAGGFMTDFIHKSAQVIENSFTQAFLKGSEKR